MNKIQRWFSTPVFLLGLGVLAFGIQALWLGYYLDDWVFLYHIYRGGYERLAAYSFGVNRPFGAWPWMMGFTLLGYSPLKWQIWSLAWRWLTVVFLWMGWKQIWPEKKTQISLAGALFLVYPVFVQQTAAVTFSDHWICFACYSLSILLMVYSFKNRQFYYPLTGLALLFSAVQLFTIEYFVGLELIRPLLLWFVFCGIAQTKARMKKVLLSEIPYALVLGGFLAWRFLWMPTPGFDRNKPEVLLGLIKSPLQTLGTLSIRGVQDILEILLGSWYKTYNPATLTPSPLSNLLSWGVVVLAFLLALAFFFFSSRRETEPELGPRQSYEWLGVNFLVMIAGFLPAWVIGQHLVSNGNYSDRFGLAGMFGASLFVVSLASFLLRQRHKIVLVCLLIGLATGYHFRLANEYRWTWENQSRLARQLTWRIPGLQSRTALYGDGTLANGSWVDIAWLNFLYAKPVDQKTEDYWYYDLNKFKEGEVPSKETPLTETRFEHLSYQGNTSASLVIQFKSVQGQCLWVAAGDNLPNPYLNKGVKEALPLSNPDRITLSAATNPNMESIFLDNPVQDWCYYFEKAQLAVQQKHWNEVKKLWHEANARGLKTGVAVEYLPFIYGVANTGDYETALVISTRAKSIDIIMRDPICQTWQKVFEYPSKTHLLTTVQQKIVQKLECEYRIK